jgi:hypothetical protein
MRNRRTVCSTGGAVYFQAARMAAYDEENRAKLPLGRRRRRRRCSWLIDAQPFGGFLMLGAELNS